MKRRYLKQHPKIHFSKGAITKSDEQGISTFPVFLTSKNRAAKNVLRLMEKEINKTA